MMLSKVVLLALLLSLSCLWVAKASEQRTRVSEVVREAEIHDGGQCTDDDICNKNCLDCIARQCIFQQCVCSKRFFPPNSQPNLRVKKH
ncbi:Defensin-like protein 267 [Arabidopsis thaliana]|uniref:Defensin-like protein 267 n=3 Tax=Arabidopsis TaxID=3701 RepID=DF267_ARATH|nr:Putative membrane lipoprotein [Arabidopsis thaliana]Q2V354.1 RecName: Full=Defensin-like protein 267; Flags: Precursor [Arabidopsis thaliana]KAG7603155.1 hypothetical protein ISN45_At05g021470 [Arabidopsis thaliana x Arabidopsis arenosa]AED93111.1 Putative membrane lipoprotein [Arabidopsis thaliana]OAO94317.1 hypothetical protein AXX17_AT5G22540 [Arabidopsis thaliana]VYS67645.1 unnamed protein product [Arabidopsis thaliana]|eukprot:NP_001031925.1 Putative membrane lipoprotein [Arabidopsis thaliana]